MAWVEWYFPDEIAPDLDVESQLRTAVAVLETFRDRVYALVPREEHISDHDVVEWLRDNLPKETL